MNEQSLYVIKCECGAEIRTHEAETICAKCHRSIRVEWQGADRDGLPPGLRLEAGKA